MDKVAEIRPKASLSPIARVHRPGRACLANDDAGQAGERGLEAIPYPARDLLAGRIFEAGDLVEIVVVQHPVERLERGADVGEVHHPARLRIDRAGHMNLHAEAVPMKPPALVALPHM